MITIFVQYKYFKDRKMGGEEVHEPMRLHGFWCRMATVQGRGCGVGR